MRLAYCSERHGHGFQRVYVTVPVKPTNSPVLWHSALTAVPAVRLEERTVEENDAAPVPEAATSIIRHTPEVATQITRHGLPSVCRGSERFSVRSW